MSDHEICPICGQEGSRCSLYERYGADVCFKHADESPMLGCLKVNGQVLHVRQGWALKVKEHLMYLGIA